MRKRTISFVLAVLFLTVQFIAAQEHQMMHQISLVKRAIAVITPTKGNSVHGTVTFEEEKNGIHIIADLTGLTAGKHGFHIHEFGDITSEDGNSAGGHYNPSMMPHSMPMDEKRHAGDMGNIVADEKGSAHLDYIDPTMKLNGEYSIIGHAVIVHAKEDDFKTQPTGNAGPRVGYGVIGIAK